MKIDIGTILSLVGVGMRAVEKIKGAKGKEKETAVIESVQESIPQIESMAGVDFVNNDALNGLLADYIAARVALANGIANAKNLKPTK
jgi:hypothetical protein